MPFYKLKTGPSFFFSFSFFLFRKSHSPCRKKRIFERKNKQKNNQKKTHFYKLKAGPIMLRNILGPVFNLYLDQFLTYKICYFFFLLFFLGGGAETPMFIVFQLKMQNLKNHKKEKKTLFVNTIVLTALVKMSVFLSAFCCFFNFHFFRDVFDWFPKIKKYKKNTKQAKQKTRTKGRQKKQSKNQWNIMIQNKARQQAEQQKPKNNLK